MTTAESTISLPRKLNFRDRLILSVLIGIATGIISIYLSVLQGGGAGDLRYTLLLARDWLAGKDPYLPYKLNVDPFAVPYPFTGVILTIPLFWLPDSIAAGIFTGLGAGILAWLIFSKGETWRLLMFLSWPFINNLLFTQWAPYIASMYFTPGLLSFLFVKPQLALPFALIQKPNTTGFLSAGILLALSFVLYPTWLSDWLSTLHNFAGFPPLITLPLGPLLLLALIRYRDKRAWLLVLLAAMPQRMIYDQLGVLLIAENRKQQLFLVLCSWISLPFLIYYHGWENIPLDWRFWILIESYFPALIIVLLPAIKSFPIMIGIRDGHSR